jgi:hypothetical protein
MSHEIQISNTITDVILHEGTTPSFVCGFCFRLTYKSKIERATIDLDILASHAIDKSLIRIPIITHAGGRRPK